MRLRSGISAFACVAFLLGLFQPCDEKRMNSIFNNKKYFAIVFSVISFQFSTKEAESNHTQRILHEILINR